MTIKYLGSKRRLVPTLVAMAGSAGASSALDLFSGTSRVARAMKAAGLLVTAVDSATYAKVLADTYVATDAAELERAELERAIGELNGLEGRVGYVTEVFSEQARYFHPDNGRRIDAIRDAIEERWAASPLHPLLLASLLEAADRVDSTTGLQMAYLKSWAPRALRPLEMRVPELLAGPGRALLGDATTLVATLGAVDVAYLDPPYNQHRYFGNYHVWETLVRWDAPEHYGVACKRVDCRDEANASPFNKRRQMPLALAEVIASVRAGLLLVSYNDESWLGVGDLVAMCEAAGRSCAAVIGIERPRYVGARIGIHNPKGVKVGRVSHVRNTELVVVSGERSEVAEAVAAGLAAAARSGLAAFELDAGSSAPERRRA